MDHGAASAPPASGSGMASDVATPPRPVGPRQVLAEIPWLFSVPAGTLDRLAEHAVMHRVPAGSLLFEQAETPAFAPFLIGGCIELLAVRGSDEVLVELARPIDLLIPAAVLNCQPYLLRARVLEEAQLLLVQAATFRDLVAADHALALAMLACQAAQFRRQVKQVKNVKLRAAEERVGCYLVRLLEVAPPGRPVRLPLEKRLIASQLGMTRETFSRALAAVTRHGLLVDGDRVVLTDAAAAQARFPADPLIDGGEAILPLSAKRP